MDSESQLISLISQLLFLEDFWNLKYHGLDSETKSVSIQIISVVSSMDLNSQPKPETEFMSLITQAISVFYSMDFDSQPMPLRKFISFVSRLISLPDYRSDSDSRHIEFNEILNLKPEPELVSLIYQIFSFVISVGSKSGKFISLCPQKQLTFRNGKFHLIEEEGPWHTRDNKWKCLPWYWVKLKLPGEDATGFYCKGCFGKKHEEYKKAPIEIKHPLHRKHSLHLVLFEWFSAVLSALNSPEKRQCYCCDEDLERIFYYCSTCDFAIKFACARKPPVLSIDYPKWHEHTLHLFPRHASCLTCNLCALAHASSPLYMCPNCDFVAHRRCINLPRVIRISRHHHRISFTSSFDHGDLSCCVCRRKIDNDYGGYSCIKDGCSYAAHSRCATQRNIWDGKELEGEPEEEEDTEDIEPFVRISDGIIEHFSHKHHHLKLDENTGRDYDENKVCHACITPIYFGNFYSCIQCEFILHEECANLSRKIYHPIHPHLLTLRYEDNSFEMSECEACSLLCMAGFFYKCSKALCCFFKLHMQCATVSEPLVHESHIHPLFLTCIPGERQRICSICKDPSYRLTKETFNCIEECDFALCFKCATLPHKVRYKHDKHILTLSYGKEISTMTYWCEVCEGKVDPQQRFYMCDEYCCVTLHIECLLGKDLYVKPGSSLFHNVYTEVHVLPNNHHMTRPICSSCERRCSQKIFFQSSGSIYCSICCTNSVSMNVPRGLKFKLPQSEFSVNTSLLESDLHFTSTVTTVTYI